MSFGITMAVAAGEFEKLMREKHAPIARTAKAAMVEAGDIFKSEARANMAAQGFKRRFQNSFRVDVYPKRIDSVDAAVYAHHKVPYAGVFETGHVFKGSPLMWVPITGMPATINRRRMTPKMFNQKIGPLMPMTSKRGTPLLGADVRLSKTQAQRDHPKVSLAALRRGAAGSGVPRTVPVFAGIERANLQKKLDIGGLAQRTRDRLPALYARNFRDE